MVGVTEVLYVCFPGKFLIHLPVVWMHLTSVSYSKYHSSFVCYTVQYQCSFEYYHAVYHQLFLYFCPWLNFIRINFCPGRSNNEVVIKLNTLKSYDLFKKSYDMLKNVTCQKSYDMFKTLQWVHEVATLFSCPACTIICMGIENPLSDVLKCFAF